MRKLSLAALCVAPLAISSALADDIASALDHGPIGVMGDHLHNKGEWMLSYRAMRMDMEGNRIGTDSISPARIATTIPNRFGMPPTLRVVPLEMQMTMHMVGAMYAPTDNITLMVMGNYVTKEMDHLTFQGGMGTNELGEFTTEASDFGDTSVTALFRIWKEEHAQIHGGIGLSLPTGSTDETDTVLSPMNTMPELRLPYPMQLGSGTYDLLPSLTFTNKTHDARFGGGVQYSGVIRLDENDEGYALGDKHQLTAWGAWSPDPRVSFSLRGTAMSIGEVDGIDAMIAAPVQTANPDFQGGETVEVGPGINLYAVDGPLKGHRLAFEVMFPVSRDLNGPQLETDWTATLGWQKSF
ncbi:transporter [Parvularcula marina]|uniref:Transporter n=1 Tax=Parvularcula marina TaxID=2292771 RepID=A0A371REV4_9PROT|nr:transporter [Parvularcula marina]RFB03991.1 transporter [Parvularcula marina]